MSILIKGMEMPKDCNNCCFHGFGDRDCKLIVCSLTGNSTPLSHMADCPLIEVPPHGPLIDYKQTVRELRDPHFVYHFSRDYLKNMMDDAADAIEELCELVEWLSPFCPHCEAKMNTEEGEGHEQN